MLTYMEPKIKNKIEKLIETGTIAKKDVAAAVIGAGLSTDIVYRMLNGDTNFSINTVAKVAAELGLPSIASIIDLETDPAYEPETDH